MLDVLLAEDVRRQDEQASAFGVGVDRLMEAAGHAVASAARRMLGGTYGRRVLVLCGKGNNGGDGFVAARVLESWGARCVVVVTGDEQSPPAAAARARFRGPVVPVGGAREAVSRADLVIDALLGVGSTRAPVGAVAEAIALTNGKRVLSVDVPSGVVSDTGAVPGPAVRAEATVTLSGWKPGLLFAPGRAYAGTVEVVPIGIPDAVARPTIFALEPEDVADALPRRTLLSHKRNAGTILVVAGSRAMPGAAALVCSAAVNAGAGLTMLAAPDEVCQLAVGRVPEITTLPFGASPDGVLASKDVEAIEGRTRELDAAAVGPGLSTHQAAMEAVRALVRMLPVPVVLDADGITAFAGVPEDLAARGGRTILTPHAGELARLLGRTVAGVEADRIAAVREAAARARAVVVFKGPGSVIADPDGGCFVNPTGGPELAQGGTGDVLTGLLGAVVAQASAHGGRIDARLVAAAVWVHGRAGDRLAERRRPLPAPASMVAEELATVVHEVME